MSRLITVQYLKKETDISANVDADTLDNPIKWAMDRLKFLLGNVLYDAIYSQATTTPTTFSAENAALFDPYIKQYLAWQAYEFYVTRSMSLETRTGFRVHKDDTSDPAGAEDLNARIRAAKEQTQFYKGQMLNFITQEQELNGSYASYDEDCENNKFGSGSGITGVARLDHSQRDIDYKIFNNGY